MFKNTYQSGFISILYAGGAKPLGIWGQVVKNGHIRRVTDEDVQTLALEVMGTNVATTYIICPSERQQTLGIRLPFFVMVVKNMKKYFTFEITILGSSYLETLRVQIHANVRIRRIYFSDRLYAEDEMPQEFKLYVPITSQKQKVGKVEAKGQKVLSEDKATGADKVRQSIDVLLDGIELEQVPSGALPTPTESALPESEHIEEEKPIEAMSIATVEAAEEMTEGQEFSEPINLEEEMSEMMSETQPEYEDELGEEEVQVELPPDEIAPSEVTSEEHAPNEVPVEEPVAEDEVPKDDEAPKEEEEVPKEAE